jgi:hypothetical protein
METVTDNQSPVGIERYEVMDVERITQGFEIRSIRDSVRIVFKESGDL